MIESIVVMNSVILSTIDGSGLFLAPTPANPWMDRNSELCIAGNKHGAGLLIGFL